VKGSTYVIAFDPDGNTWVGGRRGSISIFDGETWEVMSIPKSSREFINGWGAVVFDEQGRAWIGYRENVHIFDGNDWKFFTLDTSKNTFVDDIAVDSEGQVWISWKPDRPNGLTGISILDLDEFKPGSSEVEYEISRILSVGGYWFFVLPLGLIWITFFVNDQEDLGRFVQFIWGAVAGSLTSFMVAIWFDSFGKVDMDFFLVSLILVIPFGGLGGVIFSKIIRKNAKIAVLGGIIGGILMIPCYFIVLFLSYGFG